MAAPSAGTSRLRRVSLAVMAATLCAAPLAAIPASADTTSPCTITGTTGDDFLEGTSGADVICGLQGDDILSGLGGNDIIRGGLGDDTITGGAGNDTIYGDDGNDAIDGESGDDTIFGNAGNDQLLGSVGADNLTGNAGDDALDGGQDVDKLNGGDNNDELDGGAEADELQGGAGNDLLVGARGADSLYGGDGDDDLRGGDDNDIVHGNLGNDVLAGGLGNDTLEGHFGNDRLVGNAGADLLNGGADQDFCVTERSPGGASACETLHTNTTADDTASLITALAPEQTPTAPLAANGQTYSGTTDELTVTAPTSSTGTVNLNTNGKAPVSITLPSQITAAPALLTVDGSAVYDTAAVDLAVQPSGGGARISTVLASAAAPTRYTYNLNVPAGATITHDGEDTAVVVSDAKGALIAVLAPAWARDAAGRDVPTRYEVNGTQVTQVVDTSAGGYTYPIVADPYFGTNLFRYVRVGYKSGDYTFNMKKSAFGQAIHNPIPPTPLKYASGQAIFNINGWYEVRDRMTSSTAKDLLLNKKTNGQQYSCHVQGGFFNLAGAEWNLERFRPTRTETWYDGIFIHRCNWTTADKPY